MDPGTHKLLLLYLFVFVGVVLAIGGITLAFYSASRRIRGTGSSAIGEGGGLKFKLTNVGSGAILAVLGVALLWATLDRLPVRFERSVESLMDVEGVLEAWRERSLQLKGSEEYHEVLEAILGPEPHRKVRVMNERLAQASTLGEFSRGQYGKDRYWPILAAANKHHGYFAFPGANAETQLPAEALIEVWHVSRFYGATRETLQRVASPAVEAGYDRLLDLAQSGQAFGSQISFDRISDEFRYEELSALYQTTFTAEDINDLGELSLKHYGAKRYWPVIVWTNPELFDRISSADTPVQAGEELKIIQLVP